MTDLRILALQTALELERLACTFPKGEPGRAWLRSMATKLRSSYARTRGQQKVSILRTINDGCRRIGEIVDELGISRRDVRDMLTELVESGYCTEHTIPPYGSQGGRPGQWFELTGQGEHTIRLADNNRLRQRRSRDRNRIG